MGDFSHQIRPAPRVLVTVRIGDVNEVAQKKSPAGAGLRGKARIAYLATTLTISSTLFE